MFSLYNPNKIGIGWADEAFFTGLGGADNGLQLATMWNVYTAIQHYWTPDVRTSLYGGFFSYQANSTDVDNFVCAVLNHGGVGGHTPSAPFMVRSQSQIPAAPIGRRGKSVPERCGTR